MATAQTTWQAFQSKFQKTNSDSVNKDYATTTGNNIALLNEVLSTFMASSDYKQMKQDEQNREQKKGNPPLPSYNTRTPHVALWINGVRVIWQGQTDAVPVNFTPGTDNLIAPNLDVFFKDLNLDMAFGGPVGTIRGTLTVFSRDPLDFLSFLYDYASDLNASNGIPTATLQFGWNIAEYGIGQSNDMGNTLLSPKLDFLVMNVGMSDPSDEKQGSNFTLALQDTGSSMYENISADFAVVEDYPQNQLRLIIERCMGTRLLTLDDFLGDQAAMDVTAPDYTKLDPANPSDAILLQFIVAQLQKTEVANGGVSTGLIERCGISLPGSPDASSFAMISPDSVVYIKDGNALVEITNALEISGAEPYTDKWEKDKKVVQFMDIIINEYPGYMERYGFPGNLWTITGGITDENLEGNLVQITKKFGPVRNLNIAIKNLYDYLDDMELYQKNNGDKTIPRVYAYSFLQKCAKAALNIASRVDLGNKPKLRAEIKRLFTEAKTTDTSATYSEIIKKYNNTAITSAVTQVYKENASLFTKTFFFNDRNPTLRLNSGALADTIKTLVDRIQCRWYPVSNQQLGNELTSTATTISAYTAYTQFKSAVDSGKPTDTINKLKADYEAAKIRKAYGCRLVYVSGVPKDVLSVTQYNYISKDNMHEGAFVLIPNINPLHVTDDELPLIFGPGGSSYPYLYGGAQNIKQVMLDKSNTLPTMYGEIIDAKVNFNSMTALIAGNFSEETAIAEAGVRMSKATSLPDNLSIKGVKTPDQIQQERAARRKKLEEAAKLDPRIGHSGKEVLNTMVAALEKKFDSEVAKSEAFKKFASAYPGNKPLYKADPINTQASDRTYTNPIRPQEAAVDFLSQRLGNLLYSATSISMVVMGDPFLVRQGIGAFELLHYYIDKQGTGLRFNYLISGVYLVHSVTHSISMGSYTTNIKAFKIPPVANSFSNLLDNWRRSSVKANPTNQDLQDAAAMTDLLTQSINLEDPTITLNGSTTASRIVTGITKNTEVSSPTTINDISKFYFGIQ